MTDQRFPFHRLPDNLRLKVLQTTNHVEMMAYSLLSKKASSTVKAFRLPVTHFKITMKKQPQIEIQFSFISIKFELIMHENDERMTNLNGLPINVKVTYRNNEIHERREILSTWTNQGKTVGEWIQHLCSINHPKLHYAANFHVRDIELDVQTLRNTLPKLGNISIIFPQTEPEKSDILSAQNVLKAFLLNVKRVVLERARFQDHFSLQHIGMGNLEWLSIHSSRNLRIDDVLTLNAERIYLHTDHSSLRDLTRFFKLWKKGSNSRLEELTICWRTQIIPNWKMFRNELKGRRTKAVSQRWKKFRITNCREVRANINCKLFGGHLAFVQFTVSK